MPLFQISFSKTFSLWSSVISDLSLLLLISGIHIFPHPSHASSLSLPLFFLLYVFLLILSICLDSSTLESPSRLDEEHRLIARYAARLAAEASNSTVRFNSQTHSNYTSPYITRVKKGVLFMRTQLFYCVEFNSMFNYRSIRFSVHLVFMHP